MRTCKKAFAFHLFFAITAVATAQLQPGYVFQKDDTLLKKKYYEQALKKKSELVASLGKENAADYRKIYDDQFNIIGELLQTSRSVTSPEAHQYLQSVLQAVILANTELKGLELRVVFSRDWWPNAYSLGDGTIIINAGLMIYLDNEAELVFVLCHELAHYYLNHSGKAIKKYVETINSIEFQEKLKRLSKQQYRVNQELAELAKNILFDSRLHSRNNEVEADRQAFLFMKRSGYDCNAIKNTLQLLNVIDDTVLYKSLDIEQSFCSREYPFKKKWIEKESGIFSQLDEKDTPLSQAEKDSLKTHPDCLKRILLLKDSLATITTPGSRFLVNKDIFYKLKKEFYFEMAEQCYKRGNLSRNLYYSLLLLQGGENIPLAVYSVARCLNRIYENQKNHRLGKMVDTEDKEYSPDYNLLLRLLNRVRLEEITNLNRYFCKQYYAQMKDNAGFSEEVKKLQEQENQVH
jgi:Peptidase family M48